MAYTEQNLNVCSNWYRALCSGILTDRLIKIRKCEFAENSRARIFQKHFRGATAQPNIPLPPISGLIRPDWGEQLRLERGEDEEIVLNEPLLANPSEGQDDPMPLLPNIMEEVTEVDHAMFAPAAAVLGKEELQATIGVSLIQEVDQEIPDADAERIENEGEVQKFAVPDQTAGESPAEELVATSVVRQPRSSIFRSPPMMVRLKRRKSRSSFRPLHPRQKLCRRLRRPQQQTLRLQSLTLLCPLQVGHVSQLLSLQRQAKAWADRSTRSPLCMRLPRKATIGSWVMNSPLLIVTSVDSTPQRWRRSIAR